MMWTYIAAILLWTGLGGCTEKSQLMEYTAPDFQEKLHAGKTMFIYFEHRVCPTISIFLAELEKSASSLQDYEVLVGKVNCNKEQVQEYCTDERVQHTAFLFRDGKEFLSFNLDTVFDVNSIVSEVLFAILREEVKYVHTKTDLLAMEKGVRGKKDIVLGYVSSLGTQEHRSMMETAYVYGSKYQFILITGGPVLNHLGVDSVDSSHSSKVWFLHCSVHSSVTSKHCPLTLMRTPMSTLNLHSFLQLMEAPLVSEVSEDPSSVPPPQLPYQQTPQVFLFSRPATKQADLDMATDLAWKLRGIALMLLVDRQSPAVKTPEEYNAALRSKESPEVMYLTFEDVNELVDFLTIQEEEEEEVVEELEDRDWTLFTHLTEVQDEIARSLFDHRAKVLDLTSVEQLNADNFHTTVAQSSLTVALFYLPWDTVSKAFFSSFIEVAKKLEDSAVQIRMVNCAEWTHLCAAESSGSAAIPFQPIMAFPTILMLRPHEPAQHYSGILSTEALLRFIALSQSASPVPLSAQEEVTSFLQDEPAGSKPSRVLGLFKTQADAGVPVFNETAKVLRGEVLTGLLTDGLAEKWAAEHDADLPLLLVYPSWGSHAIVLPVSASADELLSHIHMALLHPLPELTVESLPTFLSLGKGLLILFVGEEEDDIGRRQNQALLEELRAVVELGGERMKPYLACWIHLGRTPAGMSVLGSYLGSMPPLPALVLTHLPSGSEIYQYPSSEPVVASSVVQWLQRIEDRTESAAGVLGGESWPPTGDFVNFLELIDMQDPMYAQQQTPEVKQMMMKEEGGAAKKHSASSISPPGPESHLHVHTEL